MVGMLTVPVAVRFETLAETVSIEAQRLDDDPNAYELSTLGLTATPKEPTPKVPEFRLEADRLGMFDCARTPARFDAAPDVAMEASPLMAATETEPAGKLTFPEGKHILGSSHVIKPFCKL